ncbi:MAG: phage minor head protein [Candidatus Binataceae bacterium]
MAEGIAFEDFRDKLDPILKARGWWGRRPMEDPLTGETRDVQLGSARRLGIIYDINLRTSFSEGRWSQIQAIKHRRPYLRYEDPDPNPRPEHLKWSGTVVPADGEWAQTHFPPLSYNCKCYMDSLSQGDVDGRGLDVSEPVTEYQDYTNPRTGKVSRVPVGVHPSFAYPPGDANAAVAAALEDKLASAHPAIAKAVRAMPAPALSAPAQPGERSDAEVEKILRRRPRAREVMKAATVEEWRAGWDYSRNAAAVNGPWRRGEVTPQARALYRLMGKLPVFDGTVWRGARMPLEAAVAKYVPGAIVDADAFWSVSRVRYQAGRFATPEGVILELRGASARDLSMLSAYPRQKELLVGPDTLFRVKSVRQEGRMLHVILQKTTETSADEP